MDIHAINVDVHVLHYEKKGSFLTCPNVRNVSENTNIIQETCRCTMYIAIVQQTIWITDNVATRINVHIIDLYIHYSVTPLNGHPSTADTYDTTDTFKCPKCFSIYFNTLATPEWRTPPYSVQWTLI